MFAWNILSFDISESVINTCTVIYTRVKIKEVLFEIESLWLHYHGELWTRQTNIGVSVFAILVILSGKFKHDSWIWNQKKNQPK